MTPGDNVDTAGIRGADAALLHIVEARLRAAGAIREAGADPELVERKDGAVEVWPAPRGTTGAPSRRADIVARCLASLSGSGLGVELVWRGGEAFVRCQA